MRARRASCLTALLAVGALIAAACGGTSALDEASRAEENAGPATAEDRTEEFRSRFGLAWPDTDFAKHAVEPDELLSGGPGKDGIATGTFVNVSSGERGPSPSAHRDVYAVTHVCPNWAITAPMSPTVIELFGAWRFRTS